MGDSLAARGKWEIWNCGIWIMLFLSVTFSSFFICVINDFKKQNIELKSNKEIISSKQQSRISVFLTKANEIIPLTHMLPLIPNMFRLSGVCLLNYFMGDSFHDKLSNKMMKLFFLL